MDEAHDHPIIDIKIEDEEVSETTGSNQKDRTPERDRSESRRSLRVPKRKKFEWQDEPTVFLIEFIKAHPSIWDTSDVMYRNVRMNKNLFLDLVNVLSTKYPDHGYTYEIVRRKWDSLKGYYSRKAQRTTTLEKDNRSNGTATNDPADEASDAVHWAYFDRLSFLANSVPRIAASEAGSDDEHDIDDVQQEPLNLEYSNGSTTIKPYGKRRKCNEIKEQNEASNQIANVQSNGELNLPIISERTELPPSMQRATSPNHSRDPDEFGIGKYVGKVLQDLDADLTDELVSRVVRDCIEVRHKQRLRFAEQYHNNQ